jgi:hypothetical protein
MPTAFDLHLIMFSVFPARAARLRAKPKKRVLIPALAGPIRLGREVG